MEEVNKVIHKTHASTEFQQPAKSGEGSKFCILKINPISSHLLQASVEVAAPLVSTVYQQTVELFKKKSMDTFSSKEVSSEYIEDTFQNEILIKLKNFFFDYLVFDFLANEIVIKKINAANYPRLASVHLTSTKNLIYVFDISTADAIHLKEWENFAFKSPGRKRYKDLDKQVENFIEEESTRAKSSLAGVVEEGDWICFKATLLDKNQFVVSQPMTGFFWIKIRGGVISTPFGSAFLNKKISDSFVSNSFNFGDENELNEVGYNFLITIAGILKGNQVSFDAFKSVFKLKNRSEIHNKLVEVFSYRNDLSQRRSIIEEIFNLLLAKHRFEIPKHLVLRRQEDILKMIAKQPDYHVYKAQKDFLLQVETLAEKQIKEEVVIDQIAYNENLTVDLKDVEYYLHFFNNKRLQKFVYFMPPVESINDLSVALNMGFMMPTVLREKTLNFIINTLTR